MNRKLLTAAIASAVAAPMAANAIEHSVSGHVNRMIRFADDGKASEIQQLDNAASQTRIRWRGTGDIGRGMKAGIYIETGVSSSPSGDAPIKLNGDDDEDGESFDDAFTIRHSRLDFSGKWGRLTLGHTSPAGDGIADQDLSGTGIANGYDIMGDSGGGIAWRTKGGLTTSRTLMTSGGGDVTLGDTIGTLDGGRKDILRYDSPALGPVTVAASVGNDGYFDIGVYGNTSLGGGTLAFAGGYIKEEQRSNFDGWGISAAYLFSQGTSIQGTYSERNIDSKGIEPGQVLENNNKREDPTNWPIKVGHKWGNNAVAIGFGEGEDKFDDISHRAFTLGFVHTIPKPGVELYAGYNYNEADLSSSSFDGSAEDVHIFFVGSRVQFN